MGCWNWPGPFTNFYPAIGAKNSFIRALMEAAPEMELFLENTTLDSLKSLF